MDTKAEKDTVEILLVEDNPGDVRLVMEGFKEGNLNQNINVVTDGEEAIRYLKRQGEYSEAERPDLVLLDLKIPKKSGLEVLEEIRSEEDIRGIPVIVLTSSDANDDMYNSYKLKANCYITKPADLDRYIVMVKSIEEYWLTIIRKSEDEDE